MGRICLCVPSQIWQAVRPVTRQVAEFRIRHGNIDGVDQTLNQDRIGQDRTESKLSIHVRHGQLGRETMDTNAMQYKLYGSTLPFPLFLFFLLLVCVCLSIVHR